MPYANEGLTLVIRFAFQPEITIRLPVQGVKRAGNNNDVFGEVNARQVDLSFGGTQENLSGTAGHDNSTPTVAAVSTVPINTIDGDRAPRVNPWNSVDSTVRRKVG